MCVAKKKTEENIFIVKLGIFHVTVGVCHLWADGGADAVVCVVFEMKLFPFFLPMYSKSVAIIHAFK